MTKKKQWIIGIASFLGASAIISAVCCTCLISKTNQASSTANNVSSAATSTNANSVSASANNTVASTTTNSNNNGEVSSNNKPTPTTITNLKLGKVLTNDNAIKLNKTLKKPTVLYSPTNINQFAENGLAYQFNGNGTATLIGFANSSNNPTSITIPNFVVNNNQVYAVTSINAGAFYDDNLTNVTFNSNLQSIGNLAFANNDLTSLNLPSNLQSIGDLAFISNEFPQGYAVYLGTNTTWNKDWLHCPFGCTNNMSKLQANIQFVIQNNAVYSFQANQNAWVIVSYEPDSPNDYNTNYSLKSTNTSNYQDAAFGTAPQTDNTTQASIDENLNSNYSANATYFTPANGLSNYLIWFKNDQGNGSSAISFNTSSMTLGVQDGQYQVFEGSGSFSFYIYNPKTNQYVTAQNVGTTGAMSYLNGLHFQYGDIVWWTTSGLNSNCDEYISNSNSSWNAYLDNDFSWTSHNGLPTYYVIKPNGIFNTLCPVTINSVDLGSSAFTLSGETLPDQTVYINLNNGNQFDVTSNSNGEYYLDCSSTYVGAANGSNTPLNVQLNNGLYCYGHIVYDNPVGSGIQFNLSNYSAFMLFDGAKDNSYIDLMDNSSQYWPAFDNKYLTNGSAGAPTGNFNQAGYFKVLVNGSGEYTFNYTNGEAFSNFTNWIEGIPYSNGENYQFWGSNFSLEKVYSNGSQIPWGYDNVSGAYRKGFTVSTSGITCTTMQDEDPNCHFNYTNMDGMEDPAVPGQSNEGRAGYTMQESMINLADQRGASVESGNLFNFWNPGSLMKQVVANITSAYSPGIDQIVAIGQWIDQNFKYNYSNESNVDYTLTINGTFQKMLGVCVDYAILFGSMLRLAGYVSAEEVGNTSGAYLPGDPTLIGNPIDDWYYSDHDWDIVWVPQFKEWITMDPTWFMSGDSFHFSNNDSNMWAFSEGPVGTLQNWVNFARNNVYVRLIQWPTGTNYWSYFKGCEYEALYNLGRWVDVPPGSPLSTYTSDLAGAWIKSIDWANNATGYMRAFCLNYNYQYYDCDLNWNLIPNS